MRIACISTSQVPSKTANSMQLMKACSALAEIGHEVRLWCLGEESEMKWEELAHHYGIEGRFRIRWLGDRPGPRGWWFSFSAVRAARRWSADLLYVWPYQAAAFAASVGAPTLLELHDRPPGRSGPFFFRRFIYGEGARRVVATTRTLLDWMSEHYEAELSEPFAIVAPNGVSWEQYEELPVPAKARAQLGLPDRFTAGYTGHLYSGRGLDLIVELTRQYPEVSFVWAGGETESVEKWRSRLAELAVDNVKLLGFVPNRDLPLVQAACEVLLMPYERIIAVSSGGDTAQFASPMKAFEYLAAGRAILASDLPIVHEVLSDSNSVLLPPEEPQAWIEALGRLINDPGQREWLGAHAKESAMGYTWTARAERALEGL